MTGSGNSDSAMQTEFEVVARWTEEAAQATRMSRLPVGHVAETLLHVTPTCHDPLLPTVAIMMLHAVGRI